MQEIDVEVIQARGTYYEIGRMQGELFRKTPLYPHHLKRRTKSLRSYQADVAEVEAVMKQFTPGLWEELHGLAEGLGWTLADTVHEYSGYQADWRRSGCSAWMKNGIYVRNYDYHPKTYDGRFLLTAPEGGYASIGFAQRMIGRIDGMNEKGLCVGYHFVNRRRAGVGFICCSIARMLLDTCLDVPEAVAMLQEVPHRHSFNYSLYDSNGRGVVVEASPRGTFVREARSCTNHFVGLEEENRHHLVDSFRREDLLVSYEANELESAFALFNQTTSPIFAHDYKNSSGTIHTIAIRPTEGVVLIGVGGDARPIRISFPEWLSGARLPLKKLKGRIAFDEVPPFME